MAEHNKYVDDVDPHHDINGVILVVVILIGFMFWALMNIPS